MYAKTTAMRFRAELGLSKAQIEQIFEEENGGENEESGRIDDCLDEAIMNMEVQSQGASGVSSRVSSGVTSYASSKASSMVSSRASSKTSSRTFKKSKSLKNIGKHECMWPRCEKVFDEPEDLRRHVYCHDLT
jgi:hypothetical protein